MKRIVFMSESVTERSVFREILEGGEDAFALALTSNSEDTLKCVERDHYALCVLDITQFDLVSCQLIAAIRKIRENLPILVLSTGTQEYVAGYAWKLGVQDYLLKPCRATWLRAAVRTMSGQATPERGQEDTMIQLRVERLRELSEAVRSFEYKKCMQLAREYIDLAHKSLHTIEAIRVESVAFVEGIAELGVPFGQNVQWKLASLLKQYQTRFDQQAKKFNTMQVIEKMVNAIFDSFAGNQCYEISQNRRILNYVDRNIKRGLSLDQVAEYANMSSCYFSKLFKKLTGCNYIAYVTEEKIECAKRMLTETDLPVVNIAYELAYSETNYFSKAFKKYVGVSPTEYRELHT